MGNLVSEMGFMFLVSFFPAGQPGSLEFVTEIADEPVERGEERSNAMYGTELLQHTPGGNTAVPAPRPRQS